MLVRLFLLLALGSGLTACGGDSGTKKASDSANDDGDDSNDDSTNDDDDSSSSDDADKKDAGKTTTPKDSGVKPTPDAGKITSNDAGALPPITGLDGGLDVISGKDASVPPPASPSSGAAVMKTATVGGAMRTYLLYVPSNLSKATAVPFVSVHHGFTMSGKVMEDLTTWKSIADREGFAVVFPDGGGPNPWNVGAGTCAPGSAVAAPETQDDFGFVKAMIDATDGVQKIARDKVFVAGFSMGGYFAHNIACKGADFIRASSAHSGGTYPGTCEKAIPMLIIHGDSDTLIPYQCSTDALGYWVTRNGCQTATTTETIKMGTCEWNKGCPAGATLGRCTLKGMDHGWAGAKYTGPWLTLQYGGGEQYENAAEMMWKFFKATL